MYIIIIILYKCCTRCNIGGDFIWNIGEDYLTENRLLFIDYQQFKNEMPMITFLVQIVTYYQLTLHIHNNNNYICGLVLYNCPLYFSKVILLTNAYLKAWRSNKHYTGHRKQVYSDQAINLTERNYSQKFHHGLIHNHIIKLIQIAIHSS